MLPIDLCVNWVTHSTRVLEQVIGEGEEKLKWK